jgi:hypothetical protein
VSERNSGEGGQRRRHPGAHHTRPPPALAGNPEE